MAEHARAKEISCIRIHLCPMRLCTCLPLRSSFTVARYVTASPRIPTTRPKNARATCIVENGILIHLSLSLSLSSSFIDEIASRILLNQKKKNKSSNETHFSLYHLLLTIRFKLFSIILETARFTIESTNFSPFFERSEKYSSPVPFTPRECYHTSIVESIRISGFGR